MKEFFDVYQVLVVLMDIFDRVSWDFRKWKSIKCVPSSCSPHGSSYTLLHVPSRLLAQTLENEQSITSNRNTVSASLAFNSQQSH